MGQRELDAKMAISQVWVLVLTCANWLLRKAAAVVYPTKCYFRTVGKKCFATWDKMWTWKCVVATTFLIAKAELCDDMVSIHRISLLTYVITLLRSHTCPLPSMWGKACCKAREQKWRQWSSPLRPQVPLPTWSLSFLFLLSLTATWRRCKEFYECIHINNVEDLSSSTHSVFFSG